MKYNPKNENPFLTERYFVFFFYDISICSAGFLCADRLFARR